MTKFYFDFAFVNRLLEYLTSWVNPFVIFLCSDYPDNWTGKKLSHFGSVIDRSIFTNNKWLFA